MLLLMLLTFKNIIATEKERRNQVVNNHSFFMT